MTDRNQVGPIWNLLPRGRVHFGNSAFKVRGSCHVETQNAVHLYALVVGAGMAFGSIAVVAGVSSSLAGSWSGDGAVMVGGADIKETARCKANYQQVSTSTYRLEAICATPSGRATQTATLRLVAGTTYQGNFHNPDYNVTGPSK